MPIETLIVFYGIFAPYIFVAVAIAGCYLHAFLFRSTSCEAVPAHRSVFNLKARDVPKQVRPYL